MGVFVGICNWVPNIFLHTDVSQYIKCAEFISQDPSIKNIRFLKRKMFFKKVLNSREQLLYLTMIPMR